MRPDTHVHALFESVGQPRFKLETQGTVREVTIELGKWLLSCYMGSKIRVTLARDKIDLHDKRSIANEELAAELESILNGVDGHVETVGQNSTYPNHPE